MASALGTYIFGAGTPDTYESLKQKRLTAARLQQGATTAPRNIGEGLTALGQAIGYRRLMNNINTGEAAGRADYEAQKPGALASLFGGAVAGGQGGAMPMAGGQGIIPLDPSSPDAIAADTMAALDKSTFTPGDKESFTKAMWPHALRVAEKTGLDPRLVVAQAAQETGWGKSAPGNNFFGVKSHGKAGGNNLATREFIDGQNVTVNDSFRGYGSMGQSADDYAQFLLDNPRYRDMLSAPDLQGQVAALGRSGYATDPNYAASVGSIAGGIAPQGGNPGANIAVLSELANNPYAPEGDQMIFQMLLQQQMQAMQPEDPMAAIELQKAQLELEQMRNGGGGSEAPAGFRELQLRAQESGLKPGTPEYQTFMRTGGGGIGESRPAGFEALHLQALAAGLTEGSDEYKKFMLTKGAGDAALARSMAEAQGAATAAAPTQIANADIALKGVEDVRNSPGIDWGTGASSMLTVPGTNAYGFSTQVEQLKGGAFLTAIQQLQGMGALSNSEGATATAAIARLDRAQSKEDFLKALDDYEAIVKAGKARAEARLKGATGSVPSGELQGGEVGSDGYQTIDGVKIKRLD